VYWANGTGEHIHDLSTFRLLTGQEPHGVSVVPGFVDGAAGDYSLRPDSPLIDAGVVIPGINDGDYAGGAPDIGAFESGREGFSLYAEPSSQAIDCGAVAHYLVEVRSSGGSASPVWLEAASPSSELSISTDPLVVTPPGRADLTVTDTASLPGTWHTIHITGTGSGLSETFGVGLLVGGTVFHLPTILKE